MVKHKNFFMVANRIFELGLKPKEFAVFCCLLRHSDDRMQCFPSRRLIAKECGISLTTVDSALDKLVSMGLINKVSRNRKDGSRSSNRYKVADLLECESC